MPEDEVMELLWQNGQVVFQSQDQRSVRKSPSSKIESIIAKEQSTSKEIRPPPQQEEEHCLFMQEDEMISWLHYPLVDDPSLDSNFCADFLYPTPTTGANTAPLRTTHEAEFRTPITASTAVTSRPVLTSTRRIEPETKVRSFPHFLRQNTRVELVPSRSRIDRESMVANSCNTPPVVLESRASETEKTSVSDASTGNLGCRIVSRSGAPGTYSSGGGEKETVTCEVDVTPSTSCSSGSSEPVAEDRKRKDREGDDTEIQSEDIEFQSADTKKQQLRGSTSRKRSRAAEVHNLSERRRRDRINEKMKALQELIPRCNKSDKASMLDEAIEYLKLLQLQVQMMSMGCGMVPVMFPGAQQYMPPVGMGIGMGMGMGMEIAMNRQMMPFLNMFGGAPLSTPAGASHLGPMFPMPPFHMSPVPVTDPSRFPLVNQSDPMLNPLGTQSMNQPTVSNSYQQFVAPHQMQLPQNQPVPGQPSSSKACGTNTKRPENLENHQSG